MSFRRTTATAGRVLRQLRHDPRTIALILFMPSVLMILLKFVFENQKNGFSSIATVMLGLFPFILMMVVTSIATLRERTAGTLERLMTLPMSKLDFILGYAIAFALLAVVQGVLVSSIALGWLGVSVAGGAARLLIVAASSGLLGMSLGLFFSAFATSEFQAVQFMPAFAFPQLLVCGLLVPRDQMAKGLQWFADIMPLTYIVDAMKQVTMNSAWTHDLVRDLSVVFAFTLAALILGAATLRRSRG
jgi:ABC-2 type transport system permease protein